LQLPPELEVLEVEDVELLELLLDGQLPEPPPLDEEEELGPSAPGMLTVASALSGLEPNWLKAATAMI
jgi:hypothetical protein